MTRLESVTKCYPCRYYDVRRCHAKIKRVKREFLDPVRGKVSISRTEGKTENPFEKNRNFDCKDFSPTPWWMWPFTIWTKDGDPNAVYDD